MDVWTARSGEEGGLDKGGWMDGVNVEFMGNIYGGGLFSALLSSWLFSITAQLRV